MFQSEITCDPCAEERVSPVAGNGSCLEVRSNLSGDVCVREKCKLIIIFVTGR